MDRPDPAHLRDPVVRLFQRRFLAEILGVLTVAQALTFLDHAFPGRVVNGVHWLLHMLQPVLLGQVVDVPALRDHAAVLIAAAPGLTHIQRYFILRAVGGRKVKVGGEHTGGHVAKLAAHDVPGAGIQLLFHPVPGELHDAPRHVLPLVAGVAGDAAQPAGLFTQLRDVEGFIERSVDVVLLFLRCSRDGHIHHIGNVADGCGAFFPTWLENPHDLKEVSRHGGDLTIQLPVGFLFRDELAPGGGKAFSGIQFFFQHGVPPILYCCGFIIMEKRSAGYSTKGRILGGRGHTFCIPANHTIYRCSICELFL